MYLYRLLSFFNHRRQNTKFLILTSKFEILLMRLKAAWMDFMHVHTAQSPVHSISAQRQCKKASSRSRSAAHRQSRSTQAAPQRHADLSDQQRERLISAMSLRNILLESYTYEMMKTQYHDLFVTTRTSIQDLSIRPLGGKRGKLHVLEQGAKKVSG